MNSSIEKILLPLDGSETSKCAIPIATELAERLHAELVLMRVVDELGLAVEMKSVLPALESNIGKQQELVDRTARWLDRMVEDFKLRKIKARAVVDVGDASERLLDFANKEKPDIIVMSTHGRRGVERIIYGSVAAKVLADAPCPVLLVRPQVFASGASMAGEEAAPHEAMAQA